MPVRHLALSALLAFMALGLSPAFAQDAVDIAAAQIDAVPSKTYVLGQNGPRQFDCSGLTWYSFGSVGIELPVQAQTQASEGPGELIVSPSVAALRRGDLLFFDTVDDGISKVTHVGVYEGANMMLNAVSEEYGLRRSDITSSYWAPRLVSARRLASVSGSPSTAFKVGDRVETTDSGVRVRRLRTVDTVLGTRSSGDRGRIDFGPVRDSVGGQSYWWWRVNFDTGVDGWVSENYLRTANAAPAFTYDEGVSGDIQSDGVTGPTFSFGVGQNIVRGSQAITLERFPDGSITFRDTDWDYFFFTIPSGHRLVSATLVLSNAWDSWGGLKSLGFGRCYLTDGREGFQRDHEAIIAMDGPDFGRFTPPFCADVYGTAGYACKLASGMLMPEAPMHQNNLSPTRHHNIRPARKVCAMQSVSDS